MSAKPPESEADWRARELELEAENARLHDRLLAAERLNETLCAWARSLEDRLAKRASQGGRQRKVDHTEIVKRVSTLVAGGSGVEAATVQVAQDLRENGTELSERQIWNILAKAPKPVRLTRGFEFIIEIDRDDTP